MALFVMIGRDGPDGPKRRDEHRTRHVAYLEALDQEGRLVFAGPIRSPADDRSIGAVIVIEAPNAEAARKWVEADPFVAAGVYASTTLDPFKKAYPKA